MIKAGRMQVRVLMRWIFSIYLILPAAQWPLLDSTSNKNEYQKFSWGVKSGWRIRLITLPPSVSRLPDANVGTLISHNPMCLHGQLQG
jgi:hypothetical protein